MTYSQVITAVFHLILGYSSIERATAPNISLCLSHKLMQKLFNKWWGAQTICQHYITSAQINLRKGGSLYILKTYFTLPSLHLP